MPAHPTRNLTIRFLRPFCAWAVVLVLAASCGGGGGGGGTGNAGGGGPSLPPSFRSPEPGKLTGNWEIERIEVLRDTGQKHKLKTGMNLRFSPTEVEVLVDEYLGPDTIFDDQITKLFGGTIDVKQVILPTSFTFSMDLDYSKFFQILFKMRVSATGRVIPAGIGWALRVDYKQETYRGDPKTPFEVDDLVFFCKPGGEVRDTQGLWYIQSIQVYVDNGIPYTNRFDTKKPLVCGKTEVTEVFGAPWTASAFQKVFSDFTLHKLRTFVGHGVVQGYIGFSKINFLQALGDFSFHHTGKYLQGDLRMAWFLAQPAPGFWDFDHIYITLGRTPKIPAGIEGTGSPAAVSGYENPFLPSEEEIRLYRPDRAAALLGGD